MYVIYIRFLLVTEGFAEIYPRSAGLRANPFLYYQNLYGKNTVNEGEYYENLTYNNGDLQYNNIQNMVKNNNNNNFGVEIFDKLMTLNETYLNKIETVTNELMEYKSKSLLLEDKASREGFYLKEVNELKTDNEKLRTSNKLLQVILITLITLILTVIVTLLIVNNSSNNSDIKKEPAQKIEQAQ